MFPPGVWTFAPLVRVAVHPAVVLVVRSVRGQAVLRGVAGALVVGHGFACLSGINPLGWAGRKRGSSQLRTSRRLLRSQDRGGSLTEFGSPRRRVTDVLLGLNVAVFIAQFITNDKLTVMGAKLNSAIDAGQWWRLLTPALLHGNILHLVSNNYALQNLGPTVEAFSGRPRFLAVYIISALTGTFARYRMNLSPSVGASGAIFGLGGALAVFFQRHKPIFGGQSDDVLRQLGQSLAVNIVMGLSVPRVDNWGHLGGLVGGALAAYLLGPRFVVVQKGSKKYLEDRPLIPLFAVNTRVPV